MPLYKCECCNYETSLLGNYKRHLNTKKHLAKINLNNTKSKFMVMSTNEHKMSTNEHKMSTNEHKRAQNEHNSKNENSKKGEFFCDYCETKFMTMANKRRHELHYCKHRYDDISYKKLFLESKKQMEKEKKELKVQMENDKLEFKKHIEILLNKVGNTTINNTQNIQLNSYGHEDMNHITDSMKTQLLKIPYGMIPKMIEAVHFNNDKPENKNIVFTNKKDNKIKVYSGDKWIFKDKDDIINDLIDGKYFILDNHYNGVFENLNTSCKTTYEKFRTFFDDNDKILHDQLKKECELVLLNNR